MKRIALLVLIFSIAVVSFAGDLPDASSGILNQSSLIAVGKTITPQAYPNADDVTVDDFIKTFYKTDGTGVTWDDTCVKILTERGKRNNRTISLGYLLPYTKSTVVFARIIKPDGTVIPIDVKKNEKVMINSSQMYSNIYDPNDKLYTLTIPGLDVGDMIRYLTREDLLKPIIPKTFADFQLGQYTSPIKHAFYEVNAPKALPLKNIAVKDEVKGTVTSERHEEGARIIYHWEIKDVPRIFPEPNMPYMSSVVQRILVSTTPSWKDISRWYWSISKPHYKVTPAMKAKIEELTKGKTSDHDRIAAIFTFVSQKVRYMGLTLEKEAPGYEPHDVSLTFHNMFGVCRDKAALLAAMLREAGYDAYPVLIMVGPKKDADVPQPYFNHAITAIRHKDGSIMLLDSTNENTREFFPSYENNMSYLVASPMGDTLRTTPVESAEKNLLKIHTTASLDAAGTLTGKIVIKPEGINDTFIRGSFMRSKPEDIKRRYEGMLKRVLPGATLTDFKVEPANMMDTTQPIVLTLSFEAEKIFIARGLNAMLPLPRVGARIGFIQYILGNTSLKKRKYPYRTFFTCGVDETTTVTLAKGLGEVIALPASKPIEDKDVTWTRDLKMDGSLLKSHSVFLIKSVELTPEAYLRLKEAMKTIEANNRKRILLKLAHSSVEGSADIRILNKNVVIEVADAHDWKVVVHMKKEIMTYNGKKKNSELKFNYNPAWQDVKLISATVTNGKKVQKVSDKEINLMDQSWVASAPRYPAGKILVVSLPGVEKGSIIDYTVEKSYRDRLFYSLSASFRGNNPIISKTVKLIAPKNMKFRMKKWGVGIFEPDLIPTGTKEVVQESHSAEGGKNIWTWHAKNQFAMKYENNRPIWWSIRPSLLLSNGNLSKAAGTIRKAVLEAAGRDKGVPERVREILKGKKSWEEKIKAIRDWVAINIRRAGPDFSSLPFSAISAASTTLQDGYGNATDQAVLLYTMLKAAGEHPQFLMKLALPRLEELKKTALKYPSNDIFSKAFVRVKHGDRSVILNDTDQYQPLGATHLDGTTILALSDGSIQTITLPKKMQSRTEKETSIKIDADGNALITRTLKYYGTSFGRMNKKFSEMLPEKRRRYYLREVNHLAKSAEGVGKLKTNFTGYPGIESYTARVKGFAVVEGDNLYFQTPSSLGSPFYLPSNERIYPYYRGSTTRRHTVTRIVLPKGFDTPVIIPETLSWRAPGGAGEIRVIIDHTLDSGSGRLEYTLTQEEMLKPFLMDALGYPELLQINRRLNNPSMRTFLFKK